MKQNSDSKNNQDGKDISTFESNDNDDKDNNDIGNDNKSKNALDKSKSGNAIGIIRSKLKDLTFSILNANSSLNSESNSDNSNTSKSEDKKNNGNDDNDDKKDGWDEICLGMWKQTGRARDAKMSGKCYGISIVKTESLEKIERREFVPSRAILRILILTSPPSPPSSTSNTLNNNSNNYNASITHTDRNEEGWIKRKVKAQFEMAKRISVSLFEEDRMEKTQETGKKIAKGIYENSLRVLLDNLQTFKDWWRGNGNGGTNNK